MSDPTVGEPTPFNDDEAVRAAEVSRFWEVARSRAGVTRLSFITGYSPAATVPPPVGALGSTPAEADAAVERVLAGEVTGATTALGELEAAGEPLPEAGDLWIAADGAGRPRALLRTTAVQVAALAEVAEDQAAAEGHADLAAWRSAVDPYLAERLGPLGTGVDGTTQVVLERFEVLYP